MRVALTGCSGFIGSFIARQLREKGHSVSGLVRETSRRDHIEDAVDRFVVGTQANVSAMDELLEGADAVIHNSVDWPPLRDGNFEEHVASNIVGSLELIRKSGDRPFVFISTIAVHHDMRPRWEGNIDEDHPSRPNTNYGAYKAMIEAQLWAEHFARGRKVCALRPCGVYGIDPDLSRSHGHALIEKIKQGQNIDKAGGGKFVHVEDVARAAVAPLENDAVQAEVVNLVDCYARWGDWGVMAKELLGADVHVDLTSPDAPKNKFSKDIAKSLFKGGAPSDFLERGHEGIRAHLEQLISQMG